MTPFVFYGTFMSGQSGHENVDDAKLLDRVRTAPRYLLYLVDELWPALIPAGAGLEIECELYEVAEEQLGRLALIEPPGWRRAPVELADGRVAEAFVGHPELAARGVDISAHRSWAAFVAAGR